tara:strand:+ start:705 stop:1961 length:1257 start_codon:yes stop_codon:yes gene_type:complete
MIMEENNGSRLPEDVIERLNGYAERNSIKLGEAANKFNKWLKEEFAVDNPFDEDPFYLSQWSEQFVIENRNESAGRQQETVTYVGMFIGIEDAERDNRKGMYDRAINMFRSNRDRAVNEGHIGILTAKAGKWHLNGKETNDRVQGSDLPWYGFEFDDMILCLMAERNGERKPIAPTSISRTAYFLGSAESGGDIKKWSVSLQGKSMNASYTKWTASKIHVVEPKNKDQDILFTNRNFHETVEYTDSWLPEHLRVAFSAERLLINGDMHNEYVELGNLLDAHSQRMVTTASGMTVNPIVITYGSITYLNREPMESEYDPTGRSYRLSIYRQNVDPVTVWVSGRMHDEDRVFEYQNAKGEWGHYNEKTNVIVVGRLRLRPFNNEMQPSLSALGIYIPHRTARPAGGSGNTSLNQFGGDEQ